MLGIALYLHSYKTFYKKNKNKNIFLFARENPQKVTSCTFLFSFLYFYKNTFKYILMTSFEKVKIQWIFSAEIVIKGHKKEVKCGIWSSLLVI